MSIGPSGDVSASAAGSHLAQTTGADVQRIEREAASRQRLVESNHQADRAAGIAETDPDYETHDRDADGRRPWEFGPPVRAIAPDKTSASAPLPIDDSSDDRGRSIDLTA